MPSTSPEKYPVPPYSDYFIRSLYGDQRNIKLLLNFINSINKRAKLPLIIEGIIRNPYNLKEGFSEKESIVDVKVTDEKSQTYDIEVQSSYESHYIKRSLYYAARLFVNQLQSGNAYYLLNPVTSINIINFKLFKDIEEYHYMFRFNESKHKELSLGNDFIVHYLELPSFSVKIGDELEDWLTFFKFGNQEKAMQEVNTPEVKEAQQLYQDFNQNEDWVMEFVKWRRNHEEAMYKNMSEEHGFEIGFARGQKDGHAAGMAVGLAQGRAQGIKQGLSQGIEQGIEKGIEQGMAKGKSAGAKEQALSTARIMLANGCQQSFIRECTGLSEAEINSL